LSPRLPRLFQQMGALCLEIAAAIEADEPGAASSAANDTDRRPRRRGPRPLSKVALAQLEVSDTDRAAGGRAAQSRGILKAGGR
jgi:hypothetical protein